jgi:hypothetical protein
MQSLPPPPRDPPPDSPPSWHLPGSKEIPPPPPGIPPFQERGTNPGAPPLQEKSTNTASAEDMSFADTIEEFNVFAKEFNLQAKVLMQL